ncbi:YlxR family protein [Williamsia sp.]|uniref:YlxR family protein n=1 Tax=Williamsia sp. TaxID=1872085 RepID=UPI002F9554C0
MRTCVGCRQCHPTADFVRLVARRDDKETVVVIDHRRTMPGRGAWLHPDPDCLGTAIQRKAFARAFRIGGLTVDADLLSREIESVAKQRGRHQPATKEQVAEDMSTP